MDFAHQFFGEANANVTGPEIVGYRPASHEDLVAYLSVRFPGGVMHEIELFEKDGGRGVRPPTKTVSVASGEIVDRWLFEFTSPEEQEDFQRQILAAIDRFVKSSSLIG